MKSRRRFLIEGAAVGIALSAIEGVRAAAGPSASSRLVHRPYRVIYDNRIPQSLQFAQRAAHRGLLTAAIDGDLSRLWRKILQPQMRLAPALFVGLTAAPSLFCLGEFAKNHWMKVQFCAEHHSTREGTVRHALYGPANILRLANRLAGAGGGWPESMADIAGSCPTQLEATLRTSIITPLHPSPPIEEPLVSWMIAPGTA